MDECMRIGLIFARDKHDDERLLLTTDTFVGLLLCPIIHSSSEHSAAMLNHWKVFLSLDLIAIRPACRFDPFLLAQPAFVFFHLEIVYLRR